MACGRTAPESHSGDNDKTPPAASREAPHALYRLVQSFLSAALFRQDARLARQRRGHRQAHPGHSAHLRPRLAPQAGRKLFRLFANPVAGSSRLRRLRLADGGAGIRPGRQRRTGGNLREISQTLSRLCRGPAHERSGGRGSRGRACLRQWRERPAIAHQCRRNGARRPAILPYFRDGAQSWQAGSAASRAHGRLARFSGRQEVTL